MSNPIVTQLKEHAESLESQAQKYRRAIALLEGSGKLVSIDRKPKRVMSQAARNRIRDAQKLRWAKWNKTHKRAA